MMIDERVQDQLGVEIVDGNPEHVLDTKNYDLIREALERLLNDRYAMPDSYRGKIEKIDLIRETYAIVERMEGELNEAAIRKEIA